MKASDLIKRYAMETHEENGVFIERHYPSGEEKPASGSIYYYLAPGDRSVFHRLEFDEYWIYNAGETLDVWCVDEGGQLSVQKCGTEKDASPMLYFPKGVIFAARHKDMNCGDGTFVTCITVPRFSYDGSTLFSEKEMLENHPQVKGFFE